MSPISRRNFVAMSFALAAAAPLAAYAVPRDQQTTTASLKLLTDPFLQLPRKSSVQVVWFTEVANARHVVLLGEAAEELSVEQVARGQFGQARVVEADDFLLTRTAEDFGSQIPDAVRPAEADGIVCRQVRRHEARVDGLKSDERVTYRVASILDGNAALSAVYTLAPAVPAGAGARIMLTSDHQAMQNTPTNLELAARTMGELDAVLIAGDLVNIPDRASEWFDDVRGSAFFPCLQGTAAREDRGGHIGLGGAIAQNTPLFPAIGNHEVQGRLQGPGVEGLNSSFNQPVPRDVAEEAYRAVAAEVNPSGSASVREAWIENHSFSSRTYEEVFTLPDSGAGHSRWYAVTVGNVRVITLYQTRIWRGTAANPDPVDRAGISRYQESVASLADPLLQGYGEFIFETIEPGSEQYEWLVRELASPERRACEYTIVQLHEAPHGLGDNVTPPHCDPERIEEHDDAGNLVGVRYEYELDRNPFFSDVVPMLEDAGVHLVLNGHSHLWNRFVAANGVTHYLEGSNTGNTYGAFTTRNGKNRHVPPAPWLSENYPVTDNPGGLEPEVPNIEPFRYDEGDPQPYVSSNFHVAFQMFDSETGELFTWAAPVGSELEEPVLIDRVQFVPDEVIPLPDDDDTPEPEPTPSAEPTPSVEPTPSAKPSPDPSKRPSPGASPTGGRRPGLPSTGR